jgi:hypothetical protein
MLAQRGKSPFAADYAGFLAPSRMTCMSILTEFAVASAAVEARSG